MNWLLVMIVKPFALLALYVFVVWPLSTFVLRLVPPRARRLLLTNIGPSHPRADAREVRLRP